MAVEGTDHRHQGRRPGLLCSLLRNLQIKAVRLRTRRPLSDTGPVRQLISDVRTPWLGELTRVHTTCVIVTHPVNWEVFAQSEIGWVVYPYDSALIMEWLAVLFPSLWTPFELHSRDGGVYGNSMCGLQYGCHSIVPWRDGVRS